MRQQFTWVLPGMAIALGIRTAIMGILNVTPDSFSDGGQCLDSGKAVERGKQLEDEGADILDIGGESTRPGSAAVSEEEETARVLPVVERLAPVLRIPISVDTYRSGVARRALDAGAQIINDISGLRFDEELPPIIARHRAGVVLMHSRGDRNELHTQGPMQNAVAEVAAGLKQSIECARQARIPDSSIVVDPGIGFGKNANENLKILKSLTVFSKLPYPLLVGTSRKSFIRSIAPDSIEGRLLGTAVTVVTAIVQNAHIVRVHDVKQMRGVVDATDRILQA
jgi:dihydropteroate synthase